MFWKELHPSTCLYNSSTLCKEYAKIVRPKIPKDINSAGSTFCTAKCKPLRAFLPMQEDNLDNFQYTRNLKNHAIFLIFLPSKLVHMIIPIGLLEAWALLCREDSILSMDTGIAPVQWLHYGNENDLNLVLDHPVFLLKEIT